MGAKTNSQAQRRIKCRPPINGRSPRYWKVLKLYGGKLKDW